MNHLEGITSLRNHYYFLRHGQSQANVAGLIIAHMDNALDGYGLTAEGKQQVETSVRESGLNGSTIIYSSDFARTKQSAEIARKVLGSADINFTTNLRERGFGDLEKQSDLHYDEVWQRDSQDPSHQHDGVESVADLMDRATGLIIELEHKYSGKTILLVSHGDVIMALLAAFAKVSAADYRQGEYPAQGEISELLLAS